MLSLLTVLLRVYLQALAERPILVKVGAAATAKTCRRRQQCLRSESTLCLSSSNPHPWCRP